MGNRNLKILIVEDNIIWQKSYKKWLGDDHIYDFAEDSEMAVKVFNRFLPDIVLLDLGLPRIEQGLDTLDKLIACRTDAKIIVITASQDHQTALEAQKRGAYSYFSKSEDIKDELPLLIKRAAHMQLLERENRNLRKELNDNLKFDGIVAISKDMQQILRLIETIKNTTEPVLISGESGVGKEVIAKHIHNRSNRAAKPFVAINAAALPENLLENELFGHEKGAFTGADQQKKGLFEMADGGTLFLDEIGELPIMMQAKLLRVLQEREFEPLGATKPVKANVRVISATKDNLCSNVAQGTFRDDLYFRLNVVKLTLPPLKERREDIPLLIDHFVDKFNRKLDRYIEKVSDDVQSALMYYDFPGNVRELENIIEHAFVMCRGDEIQIQHLPPEFSQNNFNSHFDPEESTFLQNAEQKALLQALEKNNWNKVETAKELGVHRGTLWRKMKKYGLI